QEVDRLPPFLQDCEGVVEIGHVADVAVDQEGGAQLLGERAHPLLHRLALIGKGQLGALPGERLGDPPGERAVVGEAHDQPALSFHQAGHSSSCSALAAATSSACSAFSSALCTASSAASSWTM